MSRRLDNRVLAAVLLAVAGGMVGMSFAAVPLYSIFCRVSGYGGTTQRASAAPDRVLAREIVVRFDGNVQGLPWAFRPEVPEVRLKLGEAKMVTFIAENLSHMATTGSATFNVQPEIAGIYFNKIQCFCFTEQKLRPGERIEMPVQFFVSPDFADNRDLKATHTITLSYTFFPIPGERQPVAQAVGDENGKSL